MNNYLGVERLLYIIEEDLKNLLGTMENIVLLSDNKEGIYRKGLENIITGMIYLLSIEEDKDKIIEDLLTFIENNRMRG